MPNVVIKTFFQGSLLPQTVFYTSACCTFLVVVCPQKTWTCQRYKWRQSGSFWDTVCVVAWYACAELYSNKPINGSSIRENDLLRLHSICAYWIFTSDNLSRKTASAGTLGESGFASWLLVYF